ncbi:hypothetical protein [Thermomonas haemolytica]|uniref:Uncharacterized protein n=1 Tax=Thermomonas haemolytica TaxID=141949 RepID=A0A4R3NA98_9GAMM|nr:hypothetical protein [Thermomonas haemolytica]TCT26165.1 hypothetical protein EDC34_101493 [Thermomonas haemolytica]TNY29993.1 hypothetical protein BV505_02400 [Thermomonas haemolytica]
MTTSIRPLRARAAAPRALAAALQWRLLLLWVAAGLACTLVAALPVWSWLGSLLDYSPQAPAIAAGHDPMPLLGALTAPDAPMPLLTSLLRVSALLMLLLSPLLAGATLTAARSRSTLGFGELLRGGLAEYGPLLRLLLWSVVPLGLALGIGAAALGFNEQIHEHAILESAVNDGRNIALAIGGVLFLLAHASLEAGRGWLAADARLRSALKAWWRGLALLLRRPLAVLAAYLLPTVCSLLLALLLLAVRGHVAPAGAGGFVLAFLLGLCIAGALAWGKVARLFAMRALAEDAHARR